MGVRIEHQPSGMVVGMASYVAGASQARERKKKQLLDLYQDERRLQPQRLKYQAALGGTRARLAGRAGDDIVGRQIADPLAKAQESGDNTQVRMIQARRRRNDRARRQGKPVPYPDAEVGMTPGETRDQRDRRQKIEDLGEQRKYTEGIAEKKRLEEEDINKREFGEALEVKRAAEQHARDMEIENDLQSGKLVLSPRAKTKIQQARDEYAAAEASGKFTPEQLDEDYQKTQERIRKLRLTGAQLPDAQSAIDVASQSMVVWDEGLNKFVASQPGGPPPTHRITDNVAEPLEEKVTPQEQEDERIKREMTRLKDKAAIAGFRAKHGMLEGTDTTGEEEYPDPYDQPGQPTGAQGGTQPQMSKEWQGAVQSRQAPQAGWQPQAGWGGQIFPQGSAGKPQISPDGKYVWDGTKWRKVGQ